ncbi:GNAT family N-acetyltransferase [Sinisalibacter aestuarii]|uniref:Acetyltransferase n=1 Tax=Sinisalibacter aestuarii TaxID=2949426 RepID=A0ABQ5LPI7_9RHOB|nr:GNAT family N-acetyltransferase [Sinisalibacter aestuarii]GKY86907.1 acetyltransferase [Sinisalibacter aestuarii]
MTPRQFTPGEDPAPLLALIRESFAYMDGRIDPPSSMHRLTGADIARQAATGEIWVIGPAPAPVACTFLTPKPPALYIGKLAVAQAARGKGLARLLIGTAEARARALALTALTLQARLELTENHATFRALGFVQTAETAHPGYGRTTSLTFTKVL